MSIAEIIQDAENRFFNSEESMNLSPGNVHVDNANGVLYYSVFCSLLSLLGSFVEKYKEQAREACDILRKERGNFVRFTHAPTITNSHDNYDGIASFQPLEVGPLAEEICLKGDEIGWDFNLSFDEPLNFPTLRQPGTIAYTQICAERRPYILNFGLLIIGLFIGSFQFSKHTHHITWMRSHALRRVIAKKANLKSWMHITLPLTFTFIVFDLASMFKYKNRHQAVLNYYRDDHPNYRLALELIRMEAK